MRILIVGASGAGTTTLGNALAGQLGWEHFDTDDFYWLPSSPPFRKKRDPAERRELLSRALCNAANAVVSGSLMGWGHALEDAFDLVVFLYLATDLRLERLRRREVRLYGKCDPAFLQWAAEYDAGPSEGRSLAKHLAWLAERKCSVLRIEGDTSVEERVGMVTAALGSA